MSAVELQTALEILRATWTPRPGSPEARLHYKGPADFILREGRLMMWRPGAADWIRKGLPRHCFHNALMVGCVHRLPIVEGFAWNDVTPIPIHHAWNLDSRGRVIDVTWDERVQGRAYMGVPFAARRLHDCTWHGDASVLDDWMRHWPVLAEPWPGEDSPGDDVDEVLRASLADADKETRVLREWTVDEAVAEITRFWRDPEYERG